MALQRAETFVLMEQLGIILSGLELVRKNLSVENFAGVFGVSKDESLLEREKGQGYISIDGKMEQ